MRFTSRLLLKQVQKVTLFSKKYCGLCDNVFQELNHLQETLDSSVPFSIEIKDIEKRENLKWKKLYHLDIPVIHLNDEPVMKHGIHVQDFIGLLKEKKCTQK
jgi:hypothetical protein